MSHEAASASRRPPLSAPDEPQARILSGIGALSPMFWGAARPAGSEDWRYLSACEDMPPPGMTLGAVCVDDADGPLAAAPLFALGYRLDTPLQGGALGRLADALARRAPRLMEWRMLGVGSPFTEECPLALRPHLPPPVATVVLRALARAVEAEAMARGAGLIVFKDLAPHELRVARSALGNAGYFEVESLPVAVLDLDGRVDLDAYLSGLSTATRKDLRRKLRQAGRVRVEWRESIAGLESQVETLYASTRAQSTVRYGDFEELPANYFQAVSHALGKDAVFACYWLDDRLIAFNLLLVGPDRVVDKFLGMAYPVAREHNLYALSWLENVRFCQRMGLRFLQTGQTAYASKLRFGSGLEPRTHLVKHRNRLLHAGARAAAPLLAFPRWDPDLKRHREKERR